MSHGINGLGHGNGHQLGVQRHGSGQHPKIEGKAEKPEKVEKGSAQAAGGGDIAQAVAALDQAIKSLAASLQKDSFNGQEAPAGLEPVKSGLTNPGNLQADTFSPPPATPTAAAPTASALDNPLLAAKGGGGLTGGVVGSFLDGRGSGGLTGGVVGSRTTEQ